MLAPTVRAKVRILQNTTRRKNNNYAIPHTYTIYYLPGQPHQNIIPFFQVLLQFVIDYESNDKQHYLVSPPPGRRGAQRAGW